MSTLVDKGQEIECISFDSIIEVIREWLGAPTRKAVRTDVIATLPFDDLAGLSGDTLAKGSSQPF